MATRKKIARFLQSSDGPTSVEYAIMLGLVLGALLLTISIVGQTTKASFVNAAEKIAQASQTGS